MFKKDKKHYDEDAYKSFLRRILVCEEVNETLINKIDVFKEDGKINIDGNNLYGKIINKEGNEYLEIRYENNCLVCNYTEWNGSKIISISQIDLKNGNIKINTREKIEYHCFGNENETRVEELERIYDSQKKLICESKLEQDETYDSIESAIVYKDESWWANSFKLEKKWYIPNGSIIMYELSKKYMRDKSKLTEGYFICPGRYYDGCMWRRDFVELDKKLFNSFMTGKITIEELLEQNQNIEKNKKKVK